jgi:hypothetical protein
MLLFGAFFVVAADTVTAAQDDNYTYTVNEDVATITGYTGVGGAITIPSTLGGHATVAIGDGAFERCTNLTSISIPGGVTSIGISAFYSCSSMTSVTIGNGVITIGHDAFSQCVNLTSITIPNNVTSIEDQVFQGCTSMTSVIIGSGVTTIGNYSFADCANLTSITFLGMVAPTTVGADWIALSGAGIEGHAYAASNFPSSGGVFNGLRMGTVIADNSDGKSNTSTQSAWMAMVLVLVALLILVVLLVMRRRKAKK